MKKALIIGASSGIGKELAKLLVNDGYYVAITGRRLEELEKISKKIRSVIVFAGRMLHKSQTLKKYLPHWYRS